jgi:quinol monooxygenase YgiN
MIAIARFRMPLAESAAFKASLAQALSTFSQRDGFVSGDYGQNLDEPELWTLVTHWINVGSYRRALSSTEIKMTVVPLLAQAIDEPGAFSNDI